MKNTLKLIEKTYDFLAEEYAEEYTNEHEKKPMDREVLLRFSRELAGRGPVWDFGCGPGQTTQYLADLGVAISGMDLSQKLLEQARVLHPGIQFRKGDMLDLDFDNESIAGIVSFYAIVHFTKKQVEKAFQEIFRVLKPGGIFLLAFHVGDETIRLTEYCGKEVDIDFMFFTTDFITRCLHRVGFKRMDVMEREPYPNVEYPSRRAYVFALKQGK